MNETPSNPIGFDPARAGRLRSQALDTFQARGRKVTRYYYVWLLICLALACLYMRSFFASRDVKSWILNAVLFLVMFESTVLIKIWYWVVNSRLALLRETKLLRMDLALQKGAMDAVEEMARVESPFEPLGVSKRERRMWRAGVYAMCMVMGLSIGNLLSGHTDFFMLLKMVVQRDHFQPDASKGVWAVRFEPAGDFAPGTPGEFLGRISQYGSCYSAQNGNIGFFRTKKHGDKLTGSFLAYDSDQLKAALAAVPGVKVTSVEKLTQEQIAEYEKLPQESLNDH